MRTGYQGGRRCRAGRVAETRLEIFIRGPGPLRGSPAPAKATAGAPTIGQDHRRGAGKAPYIYFTRCRPSAPLPDCSRQGEFFDNSQTGNGAWQRRRLSCEVSAFRRLWHGASGQARGMSSISAADPISESRDTSNYLILVSFDFEVRSKSDTENHANFEITTGRRRSFSERRRQARRVTRAYRPSSPLCRTRPHSGPVRAARRTTPCARRKERGNRRPPSAGSP